MARDYDAWLRYLAERGPMPFAWAQPFDCISFALGAAQALTGHDVLGELGLAWTSLREAKAAIEAEGGIEAGMDRRFRRLAPARALRGDLAAAPDPLFGITLLVVEGTHLVGPGERGLRRVPRGVMTIGWSVADG